MRSRRYTGGSTHHVRGVTLALVVIICLAACSPTPGIPKSVSDAQTRSPQSVDCWTSRALARIDSLHQTQQPGLVHAVLDSLIPLAAARADSAFHLSLLVRRGFEWTSYGHARDGEPVLREAVELAQALEDSTNLSIALRWLAMAVGAQGRIQEAADVNRWGLDVARRIDHRSNLAWTHVGLGWCYERLGRDEESQDNYQIAADMFEEIGEARGVIWALNGLGTAHQNLRHYQAAISTYQLVVAKAREADDPMIEAFALNNLGTLEYSLGDPGLAMEHFERAQALHGQMPDLRGTIVAAHNTADCLIQLGRFDDATSLLEDLLAQCRTLGYEDLEASMLNALGDLRNRQHRYDEARQLFRQVVARGDSLPLLYRIDGLIGLSDALASLDSCNTAVVLLGDALATNEGSIRSEARVRLMKSRAERLLETDHPEEALQQLLRANLEATALHSALHQVGLMTLAGSAYLALGRSDSALVYLERAADAWETIREVPIDPEWREQRGALGRDLYPVLAEILLEYPPDRAQEERRRATFDRLQVFKSRTLLERMLGPGRQLETPADSLMTELVTLRMLQRDVLREGELLVDTYVGSKSSLLFAITQGACRVTHLPSEEELRIRVTRYRDLLATSDDEGTELVSQNVRAAVREQLFGLFFSEIEDLLAANRQVFIAPDGPLNLIPFAQLCLVEVDRSSGADIGPREWARIPSAAVLAKLRRPKEDARPRNVSRVLAIASGITGAGRPIPGTLREIRSLGRSYGHVEVRTLDHASPALDESDLQQGEILHLAAHVRINDQSPWQTEIQFQRESRQANLKAGQIATMQLPARLVVLSGCESGSGRILAGEGVLGLTNAFLSAGVPTVIASLWPVDDRATISFMRAFYDALAEERPAGAALECARKKMRADVRTSHPFYWAGFVLVGDPESRFSLQRRGGMSWVPILSIALIVAIGSWIAVRYARAQGEKLR